MSLLSPKLQLKVSQKQILTPGLVQMVTVLQLNRLELKEMINQEIVNNPVLEETADGTKEISPEELQPLLEADAEPGAIVNHTAEPGPAEVLAFILREMSHLVERSSIAVAVDAAERRAVNPKLAAREAGKALAQRGSSTQSQEALRLQLEQNKQIHKQRGKAEREAEADYKRQLKVEKAKARHRGR